MAHWKLPAKNGQVTLPISTDGYTPWLLGIKSPLHLFIELRFEEFAVELQGVLPMLSKIGSAGTDIALSRARVGPEIDSLHSVTRDEWLTRSRNSSAGSPAISWKHDNEQAIYFYFESKDIADSSAVPSR
jgi:hypothetical protein